MVKHINEYSHQGIAFVSQNALSKITPSQARVSIFMFPWAYAIAYFIIIAKEMIRNAFQSSNEECKI